MLLNIYSLILIVSGTITIILASILIARFKEVGKYAAYVMFLTGFWGICAGLSLLQQTYELIWLMIRIQYIPIALFPAFWILMVLAFLKKEKYINNVNIGLLFFLPALSLVLIWTNDIHHIYYKSAYILRNSNFSLLKTEKGIWYHIHTTYFYCYIIVGLLLLQWKTDKKNLLLLKQKHIIIIAALIPWFSNILYMSGISPGGGIDLTPFAFILTTLLIAFGIVKYRLFDLLPVAREKIIEALQEGVIVTDQSGHILYLNPEMERNLSCQKENAIGTHIGSIFPVLTGVMNKREEIEISLQQENTEKIFAVSISDFKDVESLEKGNIILFKNITERKEIEKKLREAKEQAEYEAMAKAMFISTISHEIRTPMNGILGFTHLLLQNDPREDQQEYLNIQKFSAENLLVLINDILDFTKIESGKIDLENQVIDIKQLLLNIYASFKYNADEKNISLELHLPEQKLSSVLGDPVRISQILTNLIANAIKFTTRGKVGIHVSVINLTEAYTHLRFEVRDTGIGIAPDKIDQIFESFMQAGPDITRRFGGSGLGLAIVKRLLELMHSKIELDSNINEGSCFAFELNLKNTSPAMNANHNKRLNGEKCFQGKKILIVDDNPANVLLAKHCLKKWKIDCGTSENGVEALKEVQKTKYDLILMDLQMPEMDGYTATREIRKLKGTALHTIPIIALSASAIGNIKDQALNVGINDLLSKPFTPDELYLKIAPYLN